MIEFSNQSPYDTQGCTGIVWNCTGVQKSIRLHKYTGLSVQRTALLPDRDTLTDWDMKNVAQSRYALDLEKKLAFETLAKKHGME